MELKDALTYLLQNELFPDIPYDTFQGIAILRTIDNQIKITILGETRVYDTSQIEHIPTVIIL